MKKVLLAMAILVVAGAATAQARVDLNVNIDVPLVPAPPPAVVVPAPAPPPPAPVYAAPPQVVIQDAPQFIYAPELGYYVAVDTPYNIVYVNRAYYLFNGGYWYVASNYWGPWTFVARRGLPIGIRRYRYEQIRAYRDREYRIYQRDRDQYRGTWYRPAERREMRERVEHREHEHRERMEHREHEREERRDWGR
ncbi:hypothetical protein L4X63_09635 [Geomonas sp. Red32]|uniref:hypothetical protein n=1 Tax=Geomonas sp. Red32 TaxID=2912856 RepID=UPI00202D07B9|nr:hypothetical protein [Geomonas sp. Red32]MCM0081850.1 hypothetical protein [Geomonas sp. Red32]